MGSVEPGADRPALRPATKRDRIEITTLDERFARLIDAYDLYFRSGAYEQRYPRPNPATLRLIAGMLYGDGKRVLDFGCGSGRYAVPLATKHPIRVLAYDPCEEALSLLRRRTAGTVAQERILPVGGSLENLGSVAGRDGPVDLALILFGVLGHIRLRSERIRHLRAVHELMGPDGRLVVGVPNARRRFRREQAAAWTGNGPREPGDVVYTRNMAGQAVELFYHLYRLGELEAELHDAGFVPVALQSESILPERLVSRPGPDATLDSLLRLLVPTSLAYGFIAVATKAGA